MGIGILTVLGTLTNFVVPVLLNIFWLTDFGPLLSLSVFGFTAYAILKHDLLDIKVLATQVLVSLIWLILFAKIFVSQTLAGRIVDTSIFVLVLVFGVLLVKSVINEVKQKEKLQELTEKLKALDKQKDEFLSMAAHELRAPMTAIKGYVSMVLEGDTGDIPEKARGFLADTSNITDRLIRLVNNMLNVGRIEEGRVARKRQD